MENKNLDQIKITEYYDKKKKYNMNIFTYMPRGIINDMKIIFVMSGCLRDDTREELKKKMLKRCDNKRGWGRNNNIVI